MEKYEIKKYQILELAKESSFSNVYLQKHFPQAFQKDFEVGKVYRDDDGWIFYCTEIGRKGHLYGYGIMRGEYEFVENIDDINCFYSNIASRQNLTEVTPEEWKEAMTNELIRRYGEDWKNVKLKSNFLKLELLNDCFFYPNITSTEIWNRNGCIFKDGIFAEVLDNQSELKNRVEKMQNELNELKKLIK